MQLEVANADTARYIHASREIELGSRFKVDKCPLRQCHLYLPEFGFSSLLKNDQTILAEVPILPSSANETTSMVCCNERLVQAGCYGFNGG